MNNYKNFSNKKSEIECSYKQTTNNSKSYGLEIKTKSPKGGQNIKPYPRMIGVYQEGSKNTQRYES